eukprot:387787-Rhodomonas_salina.4
MRDVHFVPQRRGIAFDSASVRGLCCYTPFGYAATFRGPKVLRSRGQGARTGSTNAPRSQPCSARSHAPATGVLSEGSCTCQYNTRGRKVEHMHVTLAGSTLP